VWCKNHPTGPTEQDYKDRYGYLIEECPIAERMNDYENYCLLEDLSVCFEDENCWLAIREPTSQTV
jgi:hypothetical protein